ncbi:MAG: 2-methoxy-6-polyprenyl-1,4-benzoquinol methylase, mitochondrial [Desulfovibrio sp.]
MPHALQYFKALADDTRLRLFCVLSRYELNVNELINLLDMGQSRVSRHLKILSSAGLVTSRRDGLWVFYAAAAEGEARKFMETVLPLVLEDPVVQADFSAAASILEERLRATRQFFNSIAEDWDQLAKDVLGGYDLPGAITDMVPPGAVAADLGCGTGEVLDRMLAVASEVIGVDGSARMLDLARRRFAADVSRVSLRIGDLEHLPLRDGEADFIAINMVLHHLTVPAAALIEARRVLKKGGRLVITDFDRHENESMRVTYGDRWLGFPLETMRDALEKTGFSLVSATKTPVEKGLFIHLIQAELSAA